MQKRTHVEARALIAVFSAALFATSCTQSDGVVRQRDSITINDETELIITRHLAGGAAGSSWTYVGLKTKGDLAEIPIAEFDTLYSLQKQAGDGPTIRVCYDGVPLYLSSGIYFERIGEYYEFQWEPCRSG